MDKIQIHKEDDKYYASIDGGTRVVFKDSPDGDCEIEIRSATIVRLDGEWVLAVIDWR